MKREKGVKGPKWSTIEEENSKQDKKIITLGKKDKEIPKEKIEDLKPNENIDVEEKEKPNFEPSGLLAKQTNTKKYIFLN